ncbi:MAG: EamA family transporter, partial [Planctomycetaceae bacterium]
MPPWSLYFRLSAALLLFATALPASQLVTAEVPVLLATALRMTAAAAVFVPVLWLRREDVRKLSPRDARWIGVIAAFGLIGSSALMLCGTRLLSCGAVCLLTTTTPAMTAAGAAVFLRDRPNWQKISWLALGALAAIGLALHWSDCGPIAESPAALLLGGALVAAAICCEASYTLVAKVVTARTAPLTVAAVSTIAAAVALA